MPAEEREKIMQVGDIHCMYSLVVLLCIHVDIYTVCNLDRCTNVHTGSMSISVHVHGASYTCTDTEFMYI